MIEEAKEFKKKVDLGCGVKKPSEWIGIDKYPQGSIVDIVLDLDKEDLKLPFGDNDIDELRAYHFLEHIHHFYPLINECHRVLKSTGTFDIVVPLGYVAAFGDPTHVRAFSEESFHHLTSTPPGNYINPLLKGIWKILKNDWTPTFEEDTEKIIIHKRRELRIILQPEKLEEAVSV